MTTAELEKRLAALEAKVAGMKSEPKSKNRWWDKIAGTFANDPVFKEAMSDGRKWRESQRPKTRPQKSGSAKGKTRK